MNDDFKILKINDSILLKKSKSIRKSIVNENDVFVKYIEGDTGDTKSANMILNNNLDFTELVYYKECFKYQTNRSLDFYNIDGEKIINNKRKFILENGILKPTENFIINKVARSINNSSKRAKASFYSYALNNDWQYFLTLTFNGDVVDRNDDSAVKYLYKKFRQKLQQINKNVKLLVGVERHEKKEDCPKGALHFHCLVGSIDLDKYMSVAINSKTYEYARCKQGLKKYNLMLFNYGFSTIVKFPYNYNRLRVTNYCISYTTKADNIGYNKKKFYHTGNLDCGEKHIGFIDKYNLEDVKKLENCEIYKDNDKMIVLRLYKNLGQLSLDLDKK